MLKRFLSSIYLKTKVRLFLADLFQFSNNILLESEGAQ